MFGPALPKIIKACLHNNLYIPVMALFLSRLQIHSFSHPQV